MAGKLFKAMVVQETANNKYIRRIKDKSVDELPKGDVLVRVSYSSLNYKDGLSASGNRGVTKKYPHTPGVDAAGVVEESISKNFRPGDEVIVTSYDLGMNTSGGFGQYIRIPADWVVKLPRNLSLKESMMYGSAGFTSALCVYRLNIHGLTPDMGKILVTGATGGLGSIAIAMLDKLGYHTVAVTGKPEAREYLTALGAKEIISREEAAQGADKPLLKGLWAGVIDSVGGDILAAAVKSTQEWGVVLCCGNVASPDLHINVFPFILRGVDLLGIDSQKCLMPVRVQIWNQIANDWKVDNLERIISECTLEILEVEIERILAGKQRGRVVVNLET
jgi:putative YhdH/YhfP family quinone oxidoreductase